MSPWCFVVWSWRWRNMCALKWSRCWIKVVSDFLVCFFSHRKVDSFLFCSARPAPTPGSNELETIQERYMTCLRAYTQHMCPQQPTRFQELLVRLPEVQLRLFFVSFTIIRCVDAFRNSIQNVQYNLICCSCWKFETSNSLLTIWYHIFHTCHFCLVLLICFIEILLPSQFWSNRCNVLGAIRSSSTTRK